MRRDGLPENKDITKQFVIDVFKFICSEKSYIENYERRKMAVETQLQRDIWELDSYVFGKLRIEFRNGSSKITLFRLLNRLEKPNDSGAHEFEITQEEYEELKKIYFG